MANKILLKRLNGAGETPTDGQVDEGELVLNTADGLLYYGDNNDEYAAFADVYSIKAGNSSIATVGTVTSGTWNSSFGSSAYASTSAKGVASFSSDNFAVSSGVVTIKDGGLATAEIADNAVTLAKMAGLDRGHIIYGDSSGNPASLANSTTDGHVLTVQNANGDIGWEAVSGGSATTFTLTGDSGSNQTIENGNTLDIAGGTNCSTVVGSTDTVTIHVADAFLINSGDDTTSGTITAGGFVQGNMTIDGTEIDLSSGDLTLDSAEDIILDADGDNIHFYAGGSSKKIGELSSPRNSGEGGTTQEFKLYNQDSSTGANTYTDYLSFKARASNASDGSDFVIHVYDADSSNTEQDGGPPAFSGNSLHLAAPHDITLSTGATSSKVVMYSVDTERIEFNLGSSPELDVTGDFTIDGTGDITLDCASGSDVIILENGGTYTPASDNHVATKKYVDDNAGGGGGSGTVNTGTANALAYYASGGTAVSDTIGNANTSSILADVSGTVAELKLYREDTTTQGTNGMGRLEIGNTDYSSNYSLPNFILQTQSGGVAQQPVGAGDEGGCSVLFRSIATGGTTMTTRFKIDTDGDVKDSDGNQAFAKVIDVSAGDQNTLVNQLGFGTWTIAQNPGSDERIKHERSPFNYGLKEIESLQPEHFKYNREAYKEYGFSEQDDKHYDNLRQGLMAQDVEKIMPELVYDMKDNVKNYNRDGIMSALINAVKELSARVAELEGEKKDV